MSECRRPPFEDRAKHPADLGRKLSIEAGSESRRNGSSGPQRNGCGGPCRIWIPQISDKGACCSAGKEGEIRPSRARAVYGGFALRQVSRKACPIRLPMVGGLVDFGSLA